MPDRATVNQLFQIGPEVTPGTAVAATKLLENLNFALTPKPEVKTYRGTGRRWPSSAAMNREWAEAKLDGDLDFQDFIYLVNGVWGLATPTTHSGGTISKDWLWTPPLTGSITPQTYTIEQGSTVRAHKVAYGLLTGFSYKGSRKDGFTVEAPMIAQSFTDAITLTSDPTAVTLAPCPGSDVNIWIDTTSGGIGTTQFTRVFDFEYAYGNGFGAFWPLNRANASFTGHVDLVPTNTIKMSVETDTAGMGLYPHLQAGDFLYIRFDAQGPIIEGTIHYSITHDMAVKLTDVSEFKDEDGVYAIEYTGAIAEDSTWGKSQTMTVTNQLAAL